ncbi:MAG TPA: 6-pyruvoyl-tetrahydropterin synthase-related protein [Pyrinomonadaceae bacterium]|nr:6-pyruvoyl-tetrahydropterin synthase-related protein [Pyrinomonadaceae bacterium]
MSSQIKRIAPVLLAMLAGAIVVLPAILFGMPNNNDLANHYHFAIPFYEALRQGNLYPGIFASPNFGYGDVVVRFYPPALYYLLAAGRFITGNWYAGSLLAMTLVSGLGSLGAYFWARCYVPRNLAVAAALFYALMPYHLAEFYQAAQLAEFAAGAALLFALAFTKRVCDQNRWGDVTGLAVAYAALVLSHLPLAVFGSITLLLYAVMNLSRARYKRTLIQLTVAVVFGLGASAFYWVTMVAEMKWIVADGANPDPLLDYSHNFVFSSFSPSQQETIWWMGLLAIATGLMCVPAVVAALKNFRARHQRPLVAVCGLLAFSFLMSTVLSKPLWIAIPFLQMAQHPFRWLAVTSTIAPVLMAGAMPFWRERLQGHRRPLALAMCGCVLIAIAFSLTQTVRGATYLSRSSFDRTIAPLREAPGIIQWLPVWAAQSAQNKASYEKCAPPAPLAKVETGVRASHIIEWSDTTRSFFVDSGAPVEARVATFYYPHWLATANGRKLQTHPASDGALLIDVPADSVTVNLEFREPSRTKIANIASIFSWTLIASVLILVTFASARRDHEPIAN